MWAERFYDIIFNIFHVVLVTLHLSMHSPCCGQVPIVNYD